MTKKISRARKANKWEDKDTDNLGRLLKAGLSTKEISECTGWSYTTVRRYRAAFFPETVNPINQRNGRLAAKKKNTEVPQPAQPREDSSTMRTPYPLFRVPIELWADVPPDSKEEIIFSEDGDHINVYEAPDRVLGWWLPDGYGDEVRMEDLLYRYTPSSEEVMRALQGPPGPVGPMGAQGTPGVSPDPSQGVLSYDTDAYDQRLAAVEATITTVARQVTSLMRTVNNTKKEH